MIVSAAHGGHLTRLPSCYMHDGPMHEFGQQPTAILAVFELPCLSLASGVISDLTYPDDQIFLQSSKIFLAPACSVIQLLPRHHPSLPFHRRPVVVCWSMVYLSPDCHSWAGSGREDLVRGTCSVPGFQRINMSGDECLNLCPEV